MLLLIKDLKAVEPIVLTLCRSISFERYAASKIHARSGAASAWFKLVETEVATQTSKSTKEKNVKEIVSWLSAALSDKDIVTGMNYYRVKDNEIRATDGRITAAHPWPFDGGFLVSGKEFERILQRMPETPKLKQVNGTLKLYAKGFGGAIETLPIDEWDYPAVDEAYWLPIPDGLFAALRSLRPFISDNATHRWALAVALENGWAYATNNVAIAGAACPQIGSIHALLPIWAIDFLLSRTDQLTQWAWTESYVAFRWANGAWMRSQLIVGQFPERAASMVRESALEQPTQKITEEFRAAFNQVAELAEDTVHLYKDRIESEFGKAKALFMYPCKTPEEAKCSVWGARYLMPVMQVSDAWSPELWPKPTPFKGAVVSGYVMGRRG